MHSGMGSSDQSRILVLTMKNFPPIKKRQQSYPLYILNQELYEELIGIRWISQQNLDLATLGTNCLHKAS